VEVFCFPESFRNAVHFHFTHRGGIKGNFKSDACGGKGRKAVATKIKKWKKWIVNILGMHVW